MTYDETIKYLYEKLPMFSNLGSIAIKKGLGNIITLCEHLDNPHQKFKSIHIAGTNGKGSNSHYLASIFQSSGLKTGLYTSPHLIDFKERVQINGEFISQEFIIHFVEKNKAIIEEIKPSFFEITVALAFEYFAFNRVDIAIIETGLGGRLDSTNIILPKLSIITNITLDHQQLLGNTKAEIAFEKAGIIKSNIPVIIGRKDPEIDQVICAKAVQENAEIYYSEDEIILNNNFEYLFYFNDNEYYIKYNKSILYQIENIRTVLTAITVWNKFYDPKIHPIDIQHGIDDVIKQTNFQGRWQQVHTMPNVIVDVGHNEDGIKHILENLKQTKYKKLYIIYGAVKDKDISKIVSMLPIDAQYAITSPKVERKLEIKDLEVFFKNNKLSYQSYTTVENAIEALLKTCNSEDLILIIGSFFIVNDAISYFEKPKNLLTK